MFAFIRKPLRKLVEWLDFPPPAPLPGVIDIHWEFMGDLLGELTALSDTETVAFLHRDFTDPDAIRELTRQWIWPAWARFTPVSREKILHTLDYCLATGSEKTGWIFPSYGIPIRTEARLFFATVRKELAKRPVPDTIERHRYRENRRQAFANTLFSDMKAENDENGPFPERPRRQGLVLPRDMQRHAASQPLELIRRWATTGITPDGVPVFPAMPPAGHPAPTPTPSGKWPPPASSGRNTTGWEFTASPLLSPMPSAKAFWPDTPIPWSPPARPAA